MGDDLCVSLESTEFFPGTLIKGNVTINVRKPHQYANITASLIGGAQAEWTEDQYSGNRRTHMTYRNTVNIVDNHKVVWSHAASPTNDLPVGTHSFPFQFLLPVGIPPSFSGAHGWVKYNINVIASRYGNYTSDLTTTILLRVKNGDDLLKLNKQPKSFEVEKQVSFFCHNVGSVTVTCGIPCTGFTPGETIPINMQVENNTSRTATVRASLKRNDRYIAPRNASQKVEETKIAMKKSPPVQPRQVTLYEMNDLKVPLNAPTIIRNCPCIFVEYTLAITVAASWSLNKTVELPIVIAFEPPPPEQLQQRLITQQAAGLLCSLIKQSLRAQPQQTGHQQTHQQTGHQQTHQQTGHQQTGHQQTGHQQAGHQPQQ